MSKNQEAPSSPPTEYAYSADTRWVGKATAVIFGINGLVAEVGAVLNVVGGDYHLALHDMAGGNALLAVGALAVGLTHTRKPAIQTEQ